MKNVHVLQTDKPSRLHKAFEETFILSTEPTPANDLYKSMPQHIYITYKHKLKRYGEYYLDINTKEVLTSFENMGEYSSDEEKIILTTDQDLIKDGVQAIDDDFLEWFVAHPSCEEVEVIELKYKSVKTNYTHSLRWGIIIPQEKSKPINGAIGIDGISDPGLKGITPKQESIEEAAEIYSFGWGENNDEKAFIAGAKWHAERSYSEEEVLQLLTDRSFDLKIKKDTRTTKEWFEQFKKK